MKDEHKTKKQLIEELVELRQRIAELEALETKLKQPEEALRESEERFKHIAERGPDVIFISDAKGILTYISPSVERISGFTPDECVGKRFLL